MVDEWSKYNKYSISALCCNRIICWSFTIVRVIVILMMSGIAQDACRAFGASRLLSRVGVVVNAWWLQIFYRISCQSRSSIRYIYIQSWVIGIFFGIRFSVPVYTDTENVLVFRYLHRYRIPKHDDFGIFSGIYKKYKKSLLKDFIHFQTLKHLLKTSICIF